MRLVYFLVLHCVMVWHVGPIRDQIDGATMV